MATPEDLRKIAQGMFDAAVKACVTNCRRQAWDAAEKGMFSVSVPVPAHLAAEVARQLKEFKATTERDYARTAWGHRAGPETYYVVMNW